MTYAEAIKAESRTLTTRGTITPAGGSPISLTSSHIVDWSIDEGDEFPLGSVMSTSYTLKLANADNEWSEGGSIRGANALKGATVSLELGILVDGDFEYKPAGTFIVEKPTYSEGDPVITLTGSDKLLTDLNDVFDDTLSYPKTVQQLLDFTLSQGSITLDGDFDTLACNGSVSIIKAPKWPNGTTIRQVMGYICAVGGCFFRVGRNGQYQIVPVHTATPTHALDTSAYMKLSDDENVFDFNRAKIVFSETDSISSAINSGIDEKASNTISISDNPICLRAKVANFTLTGDTTVNPKKTYYTKTLGIYAPVPSPQNASLYRYYTRSTTNNNDTVQAIADGLKTCFTGMTLRGINIRWRGDPLLRVGDRVELTDRRGITNETMVFKQTITYKKGLSAVISCDLQDYDSLGLVSAIPDPGVEVGGETPASFDADTLGGHAASYFATADHNHDSTYLKLTDVLSKTYPIGAVYLAEVNTSPGTLFGGTWASMPPPTGISYAWKRTA